MSEKEIALRARIRDWNASASSLRIAAGLCFLAALLLNAMTPYLADDYYYMFSFATDERIRTLGDIVPSMVSHATFANGRLVSHSLEQAFLLLPKAVFNVCNSAVFLWLMLSSYTVCNVGKKRSTLIFAVIVMCFWNFVPVIGPVCLWQVGAINYLWAVAFCLFFLRPYLALYFGPTEERWFRIPQRLWSRLLFLAAAFLFGMYSEITSAVGVLLAVGILLCSGREKRAGQRWLWLPILLAVIGYGVMLSMPAEHLKQGSFALRELLRRIPDVASVMREDFGVLSAAWIVFMVLAAGCGVPWFRRLASLGFALGGLAGNFILIAAEYYPDRCKITAAYFLILACCILLPDLLESSCALACRAAVGLLTAVFALNLIAGVGDIGSAWYQQRKLEAQIAQALENGEREITLSRVYYSTGYSPFYEMKDLDRFDPDEWPNRFIARIYGFDRVYGTDPVAEN